MRVLIADDHRLIAEGIRKALEETGDFEVVGEANTGSQVLPLVRRTNPDLVILDLRMPGVDGLTSREVTIIQALSRGLSNQAIGKELWVAEQTVKFHLTNIYRKLGVANRTEAARLAYQHGLVESPIDDHGPDGT